MVPPITTGAPLVNDAPMSQQIHIGEAVKKRVEELEMTVLNFATRMSWTESKAYRQLNNQSWHTEELHRAGRLLKYNFFEYYQSQPNRNQSYVHGILVSKEALETDLGRRLALAELQQYFSEEEE